MQNIIKYAGRLLAHGAACGLAVGLVCGHPVIDMVIGAAAGLVLFAVAAGVGWRG